MAIPVWGILKRKKIRVPGIDTPICIFQYHIIFSILIFGSEYWSLIIH